MCFGPFLALLFMQSAELHSVFFFLSFLVCMWECLTSVLPISVWVSVTQRLCTAEYYASSLSKSQKRKHLLERMTVTQRQASVCVSWCTDRNAQNVLLYTQYAAYCMMLRVKTLPLCKLHVQIPRMRICYCFALPVSWNQLFLSFPFLFPLRFF